MASDKSPSQAVEPPRFMNVREVAQYLQVNEKKIYALVNEGARILEEGIALRASDIDVVYLTGYGFPAWRGGPMYHAEIGVGLRQVVEAMQRFAALPGADAAFWQPAPLLADRAASGRSLDAR